MNTSYFRETLQRKSFSFWGGADVRFREFPQMNLILLIVALNLLESKMLVWTDPSQKKEGSVCVHPLVTLTFLFTSTSLMLMCDQVLVSDWLLAISGPSQQVHHS